VTRADVPRILTFIRGLAEYERLAHQVATDEATLERHLFGERPAAEVVFACEDGVEAGFALFFHNFSTFLGRPGIYLEDLFVLPEHRGKGYGKALLAYLAHLARERDCARLEWVVLDWNEPAIRFYRKLGAVHLDDWQIFRLSGDPLDALAEEAPGSGSYG
ncbi:MAG: GNAT family N-acetyltransferase, partial [Holophagales bacterium]|nr:GNAT family N-acetyltransferase [Holophagales bacterium]